jgi:hydrogenase expression/formation protein HypE
MVGKSGLQCGKLPPRLMAKLLSGSGAPDASVKVGPALGEDTAAIALDGRYMIVTTDPITLTGDGAGDLLLQVNANDLATRGVRPRYLQAVALLPPGTTTSEVRRLFAELDASARRMGVAITGGHTEVTDAVTRPVLIGAMIGFSQNRRLLSSGGAQAGDALVMTGAAGIEGTMILARSRGIEIAAALGEHARREALELGIKPGTSVVNAGLIAASAGAHAMHDPTEGGIGAAVHEMAYAARLRTTVHLDQIPVYVVTANICRLFGIDPLGLISSGALLIAIAPARVDRLVAAMRAAKIKAVAIGSFQAGRGVKALRAGKPAKLAWFERDELVRLDDARQAAQADGPPSVRRHPRRTPANARRSVNEPRSADK